MEVISFIENEDVLDWNSREVVKTAWSVDGPQEISKNFNQKILKEKFRKFRRISWVVRVCTDFRLPIIFSSDQGKFSSSV